MKLNATASDALLPDSLDYYLRQIGKITRLTPAEEIYYAKHVQRWIALCLIEPRVDADRLEKTWAIAAGITIDELRHQITQGRQAKVKMIEANLRLVVSIAKKYRSSSLDMRDLIQEGNIGLGQGIDKFDPQRGYRLSTYASWWIRQAIAQAIAEKSRSIRLPGHVTEKLSRLRKARKTLSAELGRAPKPSELSAVVELTVNQIQDYLTANQAIMSLDMPLANHQDDPSQATLLDILDHQISDFQNSDVFLKHDVQVILAQLPDRKQDIIRLRYGLIDGRSYSFKKIGSLMQISGEHVRQLHNEAIKKLRNCYSMN